MIALMTFLACGPKKPADTAPPVGWQQEEGWTIACYYPPDFEKMTEIERREAWQSNLEAMFSQWKGERGDGVQFDQDIIEGVEFVSLSKPNTSETMLQQNLAQCQAVATGSATTSDWKAWAKALPGQLTAGDCNTPFDSLIKIDLNIGVDFEYDFSVCKGDIVNISGSQDQYRVSPSGKWITVAGDTEESAFGSELPCNVEGCFNGMLILKFTDMDGRESIYPIGESADFKAPVHGRISVGINDDSFYDNVWYQSGSLMDHSSVILKPVQ